MLEHNQANFGSPAIKGHASSGRKRGRLKKRKKDSMANKLNNRNKKIHPWKTPLRMCEMLASNYPFSSKTNRSPHIFATQFFYPAHSLSISPKRSTHGLPLPRLILSSHSNSLFLLSTSLALFSFLTPPFKPLSKKLPPFFSPNLSFLTSSQNLYFSFPAATTLQKVSHHPALRYFFVFFSYLLQPPPWQGGHIFCHTS